MLNLFNVKAFPLLRYASRNPGSNIICFWMRQPRLLGNKFGDGFGAFVGWLHQDWFGPDHIQEGTCIWLDAEKFVENLSARRQLFIRKDDKSLHILRESGGCDNDWEEIGVFSLDLLPQLAADGRTLSFSQLELEMHSPIRVGDFVLEKAGKHNVGSFSGTLIRPLEVISIGPYTIEVKSSDHGPHWLMSKDAESGVHYKQIKIDHVEKCLDRETGKTYAFNSYVRWCDQYIRVFAGYEHYQRLKAAINSDDAKATACYADFLLQAVEEWVWIWPVVNGNRKDSLTFDSEKIFQQIHKDLSEGRNPFARFLPPWDQRDQSEGRNLKDAYDRLTARMDNLEIELKQAQKLLEGVFLPAAANSPFESSISEKKPPETESRILEFECPKGLREALFEKLTDMASVDLLASLLPFFGKTPEEITTCLKEIRESLSQPFKVGDLVVEKVNPVTLLGSESGITSFPRKVLFIRNGKLHLDHMVETGISPESVTKVTGNEAVFGPTYQERGAVCWNRDFLQVTPASEHYSKLIALFSGPCGFVLQEGALTFGYNVYDGIILVDRKGYGEWRGFWHRTCWSLEKGEDPWHKIEPVAEVKKHDVCPFKAGDHVLEKTGDDGLGLYSRDFRVPLTVQKVIRVYRDNQLGSWCLEVARAMDNRTIAPNLPVDGVTLVTDSFSMETGATYSDYGRIMWNDHELWIHKSSVSYGFLDRCIRGFSDKDRAAMQFKDCYVLPIPCGAEFVVDRGNNFGPYEWLRFKWPNQNVNPNELANTLEKMARGRLFPFERTWRTFLHTKFRNFQSLFTTNLRNFLV